MKNSLKLLGLFVCALLPISAASAADPIDIKKVTWKNESSENVQVATKIGEKPNLESLFEGKLHKEVKFVDLDKGKSYTFDGVPAATAQWDNGKMTKFTPSLLKKDKTSKTTFTVSFVFNSKEQELTITVKDKEVPKQPAPCESFIAEDELGLFSVSTCDESENLYSVDADGTGDIDIPSAENGALGFEFPAQGSPAPDVWSGATHFAPENVISAPHLGVRY